MDGTDKSARDPARTSQPSVLSVSAVLVETSIAAVGSEAMKAADDMKSVLHRSAAAMYAELLMLRVLLVGPVNKRDVDHS